jgi:hypothetical protein
MADDRTPHAATGSDVSARRAATVDVRPAHMVALSGLITGASVSVLGSTPEPPALTGMMSEVRDSIGERYIGAATAPVTFRTAEPLVRESTAPLIEQMTRPA